MVGLEKLVLTYLLQNIINELASVGTLQIQFVLLETNNYTDFDTELKVLSFVFFYCVYNIYAWNYGISETNGCMLWIMSKIHHESWLLRCLCFLVYVIISCTRSLSTRRNGYVFAPAVEKLLLMSILFVSCFCLIW